MAKQLSPYLGFTKTTTELDNYTIQQLLAANERAAGKISEIQKERNLSDHQKESQIRIYKSLIVKYNKQIERTKALRGKYMKSRALLGKKYNGKLATLPEAYSSVNEIYSRLGIKTKTAGAFTTWVNEHKIEAVATLPAMVGGIGAIASSINAENFLGSIKDGFEKFGKAAFTGASDVVNKAVADVDTSTLKNDDEIQNAIDNARKAAKGSDAYKQALSKSFLIWFGIGAGTIIATILIKKAVTKYRAKKSVKNSLLDNETIKDLDTLKNFATSDISDPKVQEAVDAALSNKLFEDSVKKNALDPNPVNYSAKQGALVVWKAIQQRKYKIQYDTTMLKLSNELAKTSSTKNYEQSLKDYDEAEKKKPNKYDEFYAHILKAKKLIEEASTLLDNENIDYKIIKNKVTEAQNCINEAQNCTALGDNNGTYKDIVNKLSSKIATNIENLNDAKSAITEIKSTLFDNTNDFAANVIAAGMYEEDINAKRNARDSAEKQYIVDFLKAAIEIEGIKSFSDNDNKKDLISKLKNWLNPEGIYKNNYEQYLKIDREIRAEFNRVEKQMIEMNKTAGGTMKDSSDLQQVVFVNVERQNAKTDDIVKEATATRE